MSKSAVGRIMASVNCDSERPESSIDVMLSMLSDRVSIRESNDQAPRNRPPSSTCSFDSLKFPSLSTLRASLAMFQRSVVTQSDSLAETEPQRCY